MTLSEMSSKRRKTTVSTPPFRMKNEDRSWTGSKANASPWMESWNLGVTKSCFLPPFHVCFHLKWVTWSWLYVVFFFKDVWTTIVLKLCFLSSPGFDYFPELVDGLLTWAFYFILLVLWFEFDVKVWACSLTSVYQNAHFATNLVSDHLGLL